MVIAHPPPPSPISNLLLPFLYFFSYTQLPSSHSFQFLSPIFLHNPPPKLPPSPTTNPFTIHRSSAAFIYFPYPFPIFPFLFSILPFFATPLHR